jgi:fructose-1,6-bisphosphatase
MNSQNNYPAQITTIERHILDEQRHHPEATGVLTQLLYDIALAGKVIASKTTRAGLAEILGRTDEINIQGEEVQKLDRLADLTIYRLNDHTGRLAALASEEHEACSMIHWMDQPILITTSQSGRSSPSFTELLNRDQALWKTCCNLVATW